MRIGVALRYLALMDDPKKADDQYSDEEIARRRDEVLLRSLNTPPKHHSEMKIGKRKPPKKLGGPLREKNDE
jgi:hypothetical protein